MNRSNALLLLIAALTSGCGQSDEPSSPDPQADAGTDAAADAAQESADASQDTTEAGADLDASAGDVADAAVESGHDSEAADVAAEAAEAAADGAVGEGGPGACLEFTTTDIYKVAGVTDMLWRAALHEKFGDPNVHDFFQMEFYSFDTGTFVLGTGSNAAYQSCEQCVLVYTDVNQGSGSAVGAYFATSGTLTVHPQTQPGGMVLSAVLKDLVLRETDDNMNVIPGGACFRASELRYGCGDNKAEWPEGCDGTAIPLTCQDLGFSGGQLGCTPECSPDASQCTGFSCAATDLGTFAGSEIRVTGDTSTGTDIYAPWGLSNAPTGMESVYSLTLPAKTKVELVLQTAFLNGTSAWSFVWATAGCDDVTGAQVVAGDYSTGLRRIPLENTATSSTTYYVVVDTGLEKYGAPYKLVVRPPAQVPAAWICPQESYAGLDLCDCDCGAWDPDCDEPDITPASCKTPEGQCVQPGVCQ